MNYRVIQITKIIGADTIIQLMKSGLWQAYLKAMGVK
jgi:hypothetical protein